MRVAVLRCGTLPSFITWEIPNPERVFIDDDLLIAGFRARGIAAEPVVWTDPVEWDTFDVALVRSTWDYLDRKDRFLEVLADIERSSCALHNSIDVVRWNVDKRYLLDLEGAGVLIVPTVVAGAGVALPDGDIVLKPTVGVAGSYTVRVHSAALDEALRALRAEQPGRDFIAQPFVPAIETEGEWSFVYFDGALSHVMVKRPAPGDYRVQGIYGGSIALATPHPADRARADAVMAAVPGRPLFARLDFVRFEGALAVMEVEVIEPILSFELAPAAAGRLVDATIARQAATSAAGDGRR